MTNINTLNKYHEKLTKSVTRDQLKQLQQMESGVYSTNGHMAFKLDIITNNDYSTDYNCTKSDQMKNVLEPLFEKHSYEDNNKIWFQLNEIIPFLKAVNTLKARKEIPTIIIKNNTITYTSETLKTTITHELYSDGIPEGIQFKLNVSYLLQVCEMAKETKNQALYMYYKDSNRPLLFIPCTFDRITSIILPVKND